MGEAFGRRTRTSRPVTPAAKRAPHSQVREVILSSQRAPSCSPKEPADGEKGKRQDRGGEAVAGMRHQHGRVAVVRGHPDAGRGLEPAGNQKAQGLRQDLGSVGGDGGPADEDESPGRQRERPGKDVPPSRDVSHHGRSLERPRCGPRPRSPRPSSRSTAGASSAPRKGAVDLSRPRSLVRSFPRASLRPESSQARPRHRALLWLLLPVTAGVALRVEAVSRARLWLDEYIVLEIASLPTISEVLRSVATSNNSPLYFLLVRTLPGAIDMPLVARIVSLLFSLATLVLATRMAFRRWGFHAAMVSASLIALSSIAVHFSSEIRPYAGHAFLFLVAAEALDASIRRPGPRPFVLLTVTIVLAIGLHPYGLILLPAGPAVVLGLRGKGLARQVGVSAASLLATAPFLLHQLRLPVGASEYLRNVWRGHGPLAPFVTLLLDVSPASSWPASAGWPGSAPRQALAVAAFTLITLGTVAALRSVRRRPDGPSDPLPAILAAILGSSVLLAAAGVLLARPVVVPGRYACALAAPFALLVGWGAARAWECRLAAYGLVLIAGLATTESITTPERRGLRPEVLAAEALRWNARGPALVLTVGLTGPPLRYRLRDRRDLSFRAFPSEVEAHPSWWAPGELLRDPERLAEDGERAAREALRAIAAGRQVFVEGIDHPVAARLLAALGRSFLFRPISRYNRALFELLPIRAETAQVLE